MLTAMRKTLLFVTALAAITLSASHSALAAVGVVEGSYIVTFKKDAGLIQPPNEANRGKGNVPFGEHSTGQSKNELAATLRTTGEVAAIFETINAVHMKMDAKEAERLSRDNRVLRVDPNLTGTVPTTQTNPGWGLDRLDSPTPALNNAYNYINTGVGQTIYLLDTGLALSNPTVAAEFGGRASIIWDRNAGGTGNDCNGHGTEVASIAGGNTYGVAKGATLIEAKITYDCTGDFDTAAVIYALNWLTANAPKGTIVIPEIQFSVGGSCSGVSNETLDEAVRKAHDAGIIVVVPAGNDGCNVANYSPVNLTQAFVVGNTYANRLPGADGVHYTSRVGWNISTFAPGTQVAAINQFGAPVVGGVTGTSFSAPYIAGIFAIACQAAGATYCATRGTANLYNDLRNTGTLGTVVNRDGTPLTDSPSRFIRQQW